MGWTVVALAVYHMHVIIQFSWGEGGEQKVREHASGMEQEFLYQLHSDKNTPMSIQKRAKLM